MQQESGFIPLTFTHKTESEILEASAAFYRRMAERRTVRDYSNRPIPNGVLENAIRAAGSAPSGANRQPWHFVVIEDAATKRQIREAAEAEEREFYEHRASQEWLDALAPLGTDAEKPFLETAPALIAIFLQKFSFDAQGERFKNYYTSESVGIATGLLIASLHTAGLATLTHTPSPMKFLNRILDRPDYERPYLLLVCGFPSADAEVPNISRRALEAISTWV